MYIGVDARMIRSSGIGKVIENILSRMIRQKPEWSFYILGRVDELKRFSFMNNQNVELIACDVPVYSIQEQVVLPFRIPQKVDVFWSPHYNIPILYRGLLLVTIHDLAHLALHEINKSFLKRRYATYMFKCAVRKAEKVMCVSQFTISELQKYIDIDRKKVNLVYNGVDEVWFQLQRQASIYDRPYFLYVGNVKPHKNLKRLLIAYKKVSEHLNCDLLLVGKKDGFITGEDNIIALREGIEDRVHFTGYVDDVILRQYVLQSQGLVFPSLYEGFGLPPLEAMAAGKPVLNADIPVLHEVCGDAALYCDPYSIDDIAEKLLRFEKFEIDKGILIKKAREYSWESSVEKMLQIIESV